MGVTVVNLEAGMPTVANARIKMDQALRTAKARQVKAIKIIHGYGSSGKGGAIKRDMQAYLSGKKKSGAIREFVSGENFSPFDAQARTIIDYCPELTRDPDYTRSNHGITIVLL